MSLITWFRVLQNFCGRIKYKIWYNINFFKPRQVCVSFKEKVNNEFDRLYANRSRLESRKSTIVTYCFGVEGGVLFIVLVYFLWNNYTFIEKAILILFIYLVKDNSCLLIHSGRFTKRLRFSYGTSFLLKVNTIIHNTII